ncbi:MAG: hypothetical protein R6U96_06225 [Promethearchaeia archaeon]
MKTEVVNRTFNLFDIDNFNASLEYKERQSIYLNTSKYSDGFYAQSARVFADKEINEDSILNNLEGVYAHKDCCDFIMNGLIRMLYLNLKTNVLRQEAKDKICDALGNAKYWYTYPGEDNAIFTTENHQILYHTAEYLAGQLFPNTTFVNSGLTGKEHVKHAKPLIKRWLNWRGQFGFSEWHSNTYYVEDISALVNLVDFAMDEEIARKAAMILDIIAFDFANNYYRDIYATTMGRCYDGSRVKGGHDSVSEAAWIMLGIEGEHNPCDSSNMAAVALATSEHYAPPPIIDDIYEDAIQNHESKERHSINIDDGEKYGIEYNEEDLEFWYGMQAHMESRVIETTYNHIKNYKRNPMTVSGPQILFDGLKYSAFLHGMSISKYAETLSMIFRGVTLETANCYTYRTPYFQLSGAQDHQKGLNSAQEHIWQATLDSNAYVFTSSPGGYVKDLDQLYMGGFMPRATFHENIGIIQYDRESAPLEGEIAIFALNLALGGTFYQHAYFPRNAFDTVKQQDGWTFGEKNGGYVALFSYKPTNWESDSELRVNSRKNAWIVELGSKKEYDSFNDFINQILKSKINIDPLSIGYDVEYHSPSQGKANVGWDGGFEVNGNHVNLEDYPRFDNEYCHQEFATNTTLIEFENQSLELNFNDISRNYTKN